MKTKAAIFLGLAWIGLVSCEKSNESLRILAIGDSHGQNERGWVNQLKELRPQDSIYNLAISGATIGFQNLGRDTLNTLQNISGYLERGEKALGTIDYLVVLLGTNDNKAVFDSVKKEVPIKLEALIGEIKDYPFDGDQPRIILATPPPIAPDSQLEEKYTGASGRLKELLPYYQQFASKYDLAYVDVYSVLEAGFPNLNEDGIHLTPQGYKIIAEMINREIEAD